MTVVFQALNQLADLRVCRGIQQHLFDWTSLTSSIRSASTHLVSPLVRNNNHISQRDSLQKSIYQSYTWTWCLGSRSYCIEHCFVRWQSNTEFICQTQLLVVSCIVVSYYTSKCHCDLYSIWCFESRVRNACHIHGHRISWRHLTLHFRLPSKLAL